MAVWLMKSEPDEFSIDDLKRLGKANWDGVRNYQARNFMRDMSLGDQILFYHSSCKVPGIVGTSRVSKTAHPDPSCWDESSPYYDAKSTESSPRWDQVELTYESKFTFPITLSAMKNMAGLEGFSLIQKGSRLSVMPVAQNYLDVLGENSSHFKQTPA
ncbi:EVE domain-containing protein [Rhodanobacter aciditrophus]|uniref:EVE domain-containing protein n=1 Tax=Rhodanobacter aciditrophus TaxID=1623218 RepID=A0ABW4B452_9GAMM